MMDLSPNKTGVPRKVSYDVERQGASDYGVSERLLKTSSSKSKGAKKGKILELVFIVAFQLASSISMSLVNKAAVGYLPYPIILLVFQTLGTVVILEVGKLMKTLHYEGFKWEKGGKKFLGVSIAVAIPMVFNMLALKYVSVATTVVFRQVSTALVAVGEFVIFKKKFKVLVILSILIGIFGSLVYGFTATDFQLLGYIYSFLYAVSMAINALYVKSIFDQLPAMSPWEKTYYQNLESTPFLILMALPVESFGGCLSDMRDLPFNGWLVIGASCFAGFAISVAGILSRTALSPTSFQILGNMSKPMTVVLSFFIFGAESSLKALVGLSMVLVAGIIYSYASRKR
uniref:Sugar phosphate transporter domain-containing protein n=1 Tax=Chloropicon laureae TaxID=464258 RepID=A0A7S2YUD7_9CHLO|mmetsp:Transcript_10492/g.26950  ORF Transcript_10492/g.26950 Transcript_10492/m.26950 type:complete len:344 (+) Transcript_10492:205-1236(+)